MVNVTTEKDFADATAIPPDYNVFGAVAGDPLPKIKADLRDDIDKKGGVSNREQHFRFYTKRVETEKDAHIVAESGYKIDFYAEKGPPRAVKVKREPAAVGGAQAGLIRQHVKREYKITI